VTVLSEGQLDQLHDVCVGLLRDNGVQIHHPEARALCLEAGAEVDAQSATVKFPADVVAAALRSAPSEITVGGVPIGGDSVGAEVHAGANMYHDPLTGEHREATSADVREFARLQQVLPEVTIAAYPFPTDTPAATQDIHALRLHLEHTSKPTVVLSLEMGSIPYLFEMLQVVWGDATALKADPPVSMINSMASPFVFKAIDVETIRQAGLHGIPVQLATCTIAGVSSPATVAGHIAVAAAEILASIVLAQVMTPGAPCIANPMLAKLDMVSGSAYLCAVEDFLCSAAVVELARHKFGVPTATKLETDSCCLDEQTGFEKCLQPQLFLQSGCNVIVGLGSSASAMEDSPLQLIIDDAFMSVVRRANAGISTGAEQIALDDILDAGPGGEFLGRKHTRKHYREAVRPDVFNRQAISAWEAAGSKTIVEKALEKYQGLERNDQPILPEETLRALDAVVAKADVALAG
jgi:trimethylamine---corrinoid protein Co-methyltransferase